MFRPCVSLTNRWRPAAEPLADDAFPRVTQFSVQLHLKKYVHLAQQMARHVHLEAQRWLATVLETSGDAGRSHSHLGDVQPVDKTANTARSADCQETVSFHVVNLETVS